MSDLVVSVLGVFFGELRSLAAQAAYMDRRYRRVYLRYIRLNANGRTKAANRALSRSEFFLSEGRRLRKLLG